MGPLLWLPTRGRGSEARIASGPPPIPNPPVAGYVLYLNSDSLAAGAVALWPDLSGNGNDAVQATMAKQSVAATSGPDGHIKVLFDGIDDILVTSGPVTLSTAYTIFAINQLSGVSNGNIVENGNVLTDGWGILVDATNRKVNHAGVAPQVASDGGATTNLELWSSRSNSGQPEMWINGVNKALTSLSGPNAPSHPSQIGGFDTLDGYFFTGNIAVVLIYPSALSDAERQSVQAWLVSAPMYPSIVLGRPQISLADFNGLTGASFVTLGAGLGFVVRYYANGANPDFQMVFWFQVTTETQPDFSGTIGAANYTRVNINAGDSAAGIASAVASLSGLSAQFTLAQVNGGGTNTACQFTTVTNALYTNAADVNSGATISTTQEGVSND